jgi:hypothetical protein
MKLRTPGFIVSAGLMLFFPLALQSATSAVEYASSLASTSTAVHGVAANKARLHTVKVFFPKQPQSNNNLSYVEPVSRTTGSQSLARFAVEQLIAGPTKDERQKGFVGAIQLRGSSNCASDFNLSILNGTARLQLCRTITSAGIGDDARAKSSLTATLKQFSSVQSVIILDRNGNCFGDMSGENRCLSTSQSRR